MHNKLQAPVEDWMIFATGCQKNKCHKVNPMKDKRKNSKNTHYYLSAYVTSKFELL